MTGNRPPDVDALLPLDRLVGLPVIDADGQPAGRIQEFRVDTSSGEWVITEYVIGVGGLLERLGLGLTLVLGGSQRGQVARADQIDVSDPRHARLTCRRDELRDA